MDRRRVATLTTVLALVLGDDAEVGELRDETESFDGKAAALLAVHCPRPAGWYGRLRFEEGLRLLLHQRLHERERGVRVLDTVAAAEQRVHDLAFVVEKLLFIPDLVRDEREQVHH